MVRASLRLPNVTLSEASNGLEAIEQLALAGVDLIILDLNMPDMHGIEVLQFVRGHHAYSRIPVIILTTRDDDASRDKALGAGATAYLTKPFAPDALKAQALELLGAA